MNKDNTEVCEWENDDNNFYYITGCGISEGSINAFSPYLCPYCGKPIKIKGDK